MTQPTGDGVVMAQHSNEPAEVKQEWNAPRLMVIGDAGTVTEVSTNLVLTDATTVLAS